MVIGLFTFDMAEVDCANLRNITIDLAEIPQEKLDTTLYLATVQTADWTGLVDADETPAEYREFVVAQSALQPGKRSENHTSQPIFDFGKHFSVMAE